MADTSQSLPEGTVLGDYVSLRTLGQGGFGITYLAKDTALEPLAEDWLKRLEKGEKSFGGTAEESGREGGMRHETFEISSERCPTF